MLCLQCFLLSLLYLNNINELLSFNMLQRGLPKVEMLTLQAGRSYAGCPMDGAVV